MSLVSAWALVFVMNAGTLPLPPAWMVMAVFHTSAQLPLLRRCSSIIAFWLARSVFKTLLVAAAGPVVPT